MKLAMQAAILCVVGYASAAQAADLASCQAFASKATAKVMDIFHNKSSEAEKKAQLTRLFKDSVDTRWIGKTIVGRYWDGASAEEQETYLTLYGRYVSNAYITKFNEDDGFDVTAIKIVSLTPADGGGFEAKTLIQSKGDDDTHVDYLLDGVGTDCRVHDIKVEGISLLITQRADFVNIVNTRGIPGVIDALKTKVSP